MAAAIRNVVLVMLDTLRADHVGAYGNTWIRTPVLDRLAGESVLFEQVIPEAMPTICVRRALHTGRRTFPFRDYVRQKGDLVRLPGWQAIPEHHVTLAELLQHHGFRTALITDTYHQFKPSMNFHRGFDAFEWVRGQEADAYRSMRPPSDAVEAHLTEKMRGHGVEMLLERYLANIHDRRDEEDCFGPQVFRRALDWLEANRDAERFFLCIDSFDPHEPWDPPAHYRALYDPGYDGKAVILPMYGPSDSVSEAELRHMRACFAGEVTMIDTWLGKFLEQMRQRKLLDETLVIVTSDHGHSLGEHGLLGKIPWAMYPELMQSICLVRHPGGELAGARVSSYVSHHDLFPTIAGMLGVAPPSTVDGTDLWRLAVDQAPGRSYVTSAFQSYAMYRDADHLFICRFDGAQRQLYDMQADPQAERNVADARPQIAERLWRRILDDAGGDLPLYEDDGRRAAAGDWYQPSPWGFDGLEPPGGH